MNLPERWAAILDDLRRQGRYRTLSPPRGVDFSSNDYLGYAGGRRGVQLTPLAPVLGGEGLGVRGPDPVRSDRIHAVCSATDRMNAVTTNATTPPLTPDPSPPSTKERGELARSGMASRLLRGQHPLWVDVESSLARWH